MKHLFYCENLNFLWTTATHINSLSDTEGLKMSNQASKHHDDTGGR